MRLAIAAATREGPGCVPRINVDVGEVEQLEGRGGAGTKSDRAESAAG